VDYLFKKNISEHLPFAISFANGHDVDSALGEKLQRRLARKVGLRYRQGRAVHYAFSVCSIPGNYVSAFAGLISAT
jgi:hypothetical protein